MADNPVDKLGRVKANKFGSHGMVLFTHLLQSFKTLIFQAEFEWMVWGSLAGGMSW